MDVQPSDQAVSLPTVTDPASDEIRSIVAANIRSGRFARVSAYAGRTLTLTEYSEQTARHYRHSHPFVALLQRGDAEAWGLLWKRLYDAAYALLVARGWNAEQAHARAEEAVQEACLNISNKPYPYDCSFEAWAITIVRNCLRGRQPAPLDRPNTSVMLASVADQAVDALAALDDHLLLVDALFRLESRAQRQVIICLYFDDLSPAQTAQKLGRTVQAVYNLKARALAQLRTLLDDDPSRSSHVK
jgi:RNA polymerase sigma-70 factor, ECF subfamily